MNTVAASVCSFNESVCVSPEIFWHCAASAGGDQLGLKKLVLTGGMAAGEALASLGDYIWLPGAQHLRIYCSIWETALEIIRPGSGKQKRWLLQSKK